MLPNVLSNKLPPSRRVRRSVFLRAFADDQRRFLTIFLLLLPSALTSPSALHYMRGQPGDDSRWGRAKRRIVSFLESPVGQSLPEIHLVLFMFSGKFYEVARRLTGVGYVS